MAGVMDALTKVINSTATEIIDNKLPTRTASVVTTFVNSVFKVVDVTLTSIQDVTKEKPKEAPKEPPANP